MKLSKLLPLIGIAIFIVLILKIGLNNIALGFKELNYLYLVLAILFLIPITIIETFKWNIILRIQKIKLPFKWLVKANLKSVFYAFITPSRLGTLSRIFFLKKKTNKSFGECSSSVILDRSFDLIAIFIFAIIGCFLLAAYLSAFTAYIMAGFIIFIGVFIFFLEKKRSKAILQIIYKTLIQKKFKSKARESFNSFYGNIPEIKYLIWPFLLNLIYWLSNYLFSFIIAKALRITVPLHYFIFLMPIATIASLLPITVYGLGTREASLIFLLGLFGVNASKVMAMSVISLILNALPALIGFFISLKIKK